MDLSVLIGLIGSLTSISVGVILEGGNPAGVLHISSFIIVIPTAILASVTATESHFVKAAFKEFKTIFKKSPINYESRIDELVEYAITVKKQGVLALEKDVQNIEHAFLKEALSMVIDGSKEEQIEEQLDPVIEETEHYYHGAAHFWLHAGETAPTIGLVGAVFGLILALQQLDNPAAMAAGIAGAFTATVMGIAGSYIFLGPWGAKLKAKGHLVVKEQQLILAACKGMARGDAPGELKLRLTKMITPMPL
ncbi:flagellar motor stator protein MotA [Aliarcobacter lanthieri]|uniref:flagellar motor stator protein MotA n=1 Tax=Aliarcobacter lanthieri TaxID=1355374 RepID=UPI00047C0512|nr:flagellar motor stator protein MotA [Aliarcobacter lanthieri]MBL3520542.1 flagellar motor stator protein MotA [Aliarcobacter lanthieri]QKF58581.1 flagellar motor stator protein [Aliarcobacter lanthieri]